MNIMKFEETDDFARAMDARDPLAIYRERFSFPKTAEGDDCIYFCGHSLGLQPKRAKDYIERELQDWAQLGVDAHFRARNPWMPYHRLLTEQTAMLVGAKPGEVVVMNSLTVNLHLMMVSFYRPTPKRHKILIEHGAFPSDRYAVKSQMHFHGFDPASSLIELKPRPDEECIRDEDVISTIEREGNSIALILLGGVNYATGQAFDMAAIARNGQARGCVVGFDVAHAAGNVLLKLHEWGVRSRVTETVQLESLGRGSRGIRKIAAYILRSPLAAFCCLSSVLEYESGVIRQARSLAPAERRAGITSGITQTAGALAPIFTKRIGPQSGQS